MAAPSPTKDGCARYGEACEADVREFWSDQVSLLDPITVRKKTARYLMVF
jgi:hypothetical protein